MILPVQSRGRVMSAVLAAVRTLAWLTLLGTTAAMSLEILLQYRVAMKEAYAPQTVIGALDNAYFPITIQHLHPTYFFFFPLDPAERLAIGNKVFSLDRNGFREPGPAHANGRKIAVLLGASSAFGHYSSSNDTTITSYLNRLQDDYFFVNAGVPSWNSTQELMRLVFEIADMKPALVIAYDGTNDAELSVLYSPRTGLPYPPGTPESFDDIERRVDDIRADRWLLRPPRLFPELLHRIDKYRGAVELDEEKDPVSAEALAAAVAAYRSNHRKMASIVNGFGGRFISIFQPIASVHRNVPESFREEDAMSIRFHELVASAPADGYEWHDFGRFFDSLFEHVPAGEPVGGEQPIFVDDVHLFDRGNELIARRLLEIIRASPPAAAR
jgi:lysophospholipase L1-like esterase